MIWLTGARGMLGSEIAERLSREKIDFVASGREVDITCREALVEFAKSARQKIDWIVNCAAFTSVDGAEDTADDARAVNSAGPENIALVAREIGAAVMHFSTDYVFGGDGGAPWKEDDKKNPLCVYGQTKLEGEERLARAASAFIILRTSWLYGFNGKNFVSAITRLANKKKSVKVVDDQRGCPTFCGDLARAAVSIVSREKEKRVPFGVYHFAGSGSATRFEFAREICALGKKYGKIKNECEIIPCSSEEFRAKAHRPPYSALDTSKIQSALGMKIPSWRESLEAFVKETLINSNEN